MTEPAAVVATPETPAPTSVPVVAPARPAENMVPQTVVDRITAEKWNATRAKEESDRKLALAEATIEELRKIATGEPNATATGGTATTTTKPNERVSADELRRLVTEQSAVERFNEACNKSVEAGRVAHPDFDKMVLQDLTRLSPIYDPRASGPILPQPLVEAALETGEAHEVLYALAKDPTNAERIMRLSPIRQAVEIAKFHDKLVAGRGKGEDDGEDTGNAAADTTIAEPEPLPNTSRAPAPIRARTGSGTGGTRPAFDILDPSKSTTAEWVRAREKQLQEKRAANGRGR